MKSGKVVKHTKKEHERFVSPETEQHQPTPIDLDHAELADAPESDQQANSPVADMAIDIWYPDVATLRLPSVPEPMRRRVRKSLRRILPSMIVGVAAGYCWRTSQQLTLAGRGRVRYVEGVATSEREADPAPHGWNIIDGHIVDLIEECAWHTGERETWLYEPVQEYDFIHLKAFDDQHGLESFDISSENLLPSWLNQSTWTGVVPNPEAFEGVEVVERKVVHDSLIEAGSQVVVAV